MPFDRKVLAPQYLAGLSDVQESAKSNLHPKIAYMRIGSATNSRTAISSFLDVFPAGDSVFFFRPWKRSYTTSLLVSSNLNALAYDYHLRNRVGGLNLSEFIMVETSAVPSEKLLRADLLHVIARLALCSASHAVAWQSLLTENPALAGVARKTAWRRSWALSRHERVRLRAIVDACFAHFYGLTEADFAFVLKDCDRTDAGLNAAYADGMLDPKGLWRVEKDLDPELRHTVLSFIAFDDLRRKGIDDFLSQNDGEGWYLPETVRLKDYGLGHLQRDEQPQPVAARHGPRLLDQQLDEDIDQSWDECAAHAELIRQVAPLEFPDLDASGNALLAQEALAIYKQGGLF